MKNTTKLSIAALSLAVGISACRNSEAADAAKQDDFKRDLQLASSTTMDLAAPKVNPSLLTLETKPQSAPQAAKVLKKGAGNRAVRSHAPTVRATPELDVAAVDETNDVVQTVANAPVPEATNEPVAVAPRPQPVVIQSGGGGDYGTGSSGGGVFGGGGGIGGVVIRGGGVDGDNCEIHTGRGRYPGRVGGIGGPVYLPPSGGIGSSRFPMAGRSMGIPRRGTIMPARTTSQSMGTLGRTILVRRGR